MMCGQRGTFFENVLIPPTAMAKLHHVAPRRIELCHDSIQAGARITKTRRELEKKAAHARTEQVRDIPEVANQCFCLVPTESV